jgi:hypothetical protein
MAGKMTQKFKNVFHILVFDVCIMELLYIKKPLSNVWNEGENTYYVCLRDHGKGFDVLSSSYFHTYIYIYIILQEHKFYRCEKFIQKLCGQVETNFKNFTL